MDLGSAPLSNAYLSSVSLRRPEKWFPLRVCVCEQCWLVQTEAYSRAAEIFDDEYAYFSSFSKAWLEHAKTFVEFTTKKLNLDQQSFVMEIASNDGYLLQYFQASSIPCMGIEPTRSTAAAARSKGIHTVEEFYGKRLAETLIEQYGAADLLIANNVLAHVPDPRDFLDGVWCSIGQTGVATFEFPHLLNLIEQRQFDTIYHEHFSYLSFTAVLNLLHRSHLEAFRVEILPTHGGSLRVWAQRSGHQRHAIEGSVAALVAKEIGARMCTRDFYLGFAEEAIRVKNDFISFLIQARVTGKRVCGYGAAAKGNTLLNFGGVRTDLLPFVVDRNPAKQGKFLPGSRIPIVPEECLSKFRPDYVVILPWNLRDEISEQLAYVQEWGCRFVVAVPRLDVW